MGHELNINKVTNLCKRRSIRSLGELCKEAGINKNSITPYIKDKRSPFTQVVTDIANTLGVSPLELITETSEDEEILSTIRKKISPLLEEGMAILLFGSRSRGEHKKFSDVDLAITGGRNKLSFEKFSNFKSNIEDAFDDFYLSINLINLDMAPIEFLLEIKGDLKFICGDNSGFTYFQGYLSAREENFKENVKKLL